MTASVLNKIQTHKRFQTTLFIWTRHIKSSEERYLHIKGFKKTLFTHKRFKKMLFILDKKHKRSKRLLLFAQDAACKGSFEPFKCLGLSIKNFQT